MLCISFKTIYVHVYQLLGNISLQTVQQDYFYLNGKCYTEMVYLFYNDKGGSILQHHLNNISWIEWLWFGSGYKWTQLK